MFTILGKQESSEGIFEATKEYTTTVNLSMRSQIATSNSHYLYNQFLSTMGVKMVVNRLMKITAA